MLSIQSHYYLVLFSFGNVITTLASWQRQQGRSGARKHDCSSRKISQLLEASQTSTGLVDTRELNEIVHVLVRPAYHLFRYEEVLSENRLRLSLDRVWMEVCVQ